MTGSTATAEPDWLVAPDLSVGLGEIELRGTVVVGQSGLSDVGLRCAQGVVDLVSPDDEGELSNDATLVSSDAAEIVRFLGRQARASAPRPMVVTTLLSGSARAAIGAASIEALAVSTIRASEGLVLLEFRSRLDGDVRGGPLPAALQTWFRDAADSRAAAQAAEQAQADFLVLLRSVEGSSARARVAEHKRTKATVDKLRRDVSRLERKYEDLAASRLGRITLKYWSWLGKIEARRAPSS